MPPALSMPARYTKNFVESLAFGPDDSYLASSDQNVSRIYDVSRIYEAFRHRGTASP
jgi:hypothetical protein